MNPLEIAAEIVTSFVANNSVPRGELAAVIEAVHSAVKKLADGTETAPAVVNPPTPAAPIRKSVTPDYLICLDDGKRFKSLRRHLATLGMTPEQYRAKWDLPSSYPMVAPNYAAQRSALAKTIGLGQIRERPVAALASAAPAEVGPSESASAAPPPASDATIEAAAPEPPAAVKSKARPKSKASVTPSDAPAKRKPGRPRKAEA